MYLPLTLSPVYIQHLHSRHWVWPGAILNWSNACRDTQCSLDHSSVRFLVLGSQPLLDSLSSLFSGTRAHPPDNHHCCATYGLCYLSFFSKMMKIWILFVLFPILAWITSFYLIMVQHLLYAKYGYYVSSIQFLPLFLSYLVKRNKLNYGKNP